MVGAVEKEYPEGTTYEQIAREHQGEYGAPIVLAKMNGKLTELFKPVKGNGTFPIILIFMSSSRV